QRRCLRVFLIGTSGYKKVPLKQLFSRHLICSLAPDLCAKVERELKINIADMEGEAANDNQEDAADNDNVSNEDDTDLADGDKQDQNAGNMANDGTEGLADDDGEQLEDDNAEVDHSDDDDDPNDSKFGLNGKPAQWTSDKFWNFVDDRLEQTRIEVRKKSTDRAEYENEFRSLMVYLFQLDLQEYPGRKKVPKLLKGASPQWQTTIHNKLLW
ncbi:hypothetical protein BV22DRAFT_1005200, partial [Leucogyrophana mollusca]